MIDDSVVFQMDATIIAGLLIMLSIASIWSSNPKERIKPVTTTIRSKGLYLTPKQIVSCVVPFSGSAILLLISSNNNDIFHFASILSLGIGLAIVAMFGGIVAFSEKKEELDLE